MKKDNQKTNSAKKSKILRRLIILIVLAAVFAVYGFAKSTIKITKAKTIVSAPKIVAKYKKSKKFKITVKNKVCKKVVSGIKIKVKIYTGKKSKTYNLKTNKKGSVIINTNNLKRGEHKVTIQSIYNKYIISAKSTIKIK